MTHSRRELMAAPAALLPIAAPFTAASAQTERTLRYAISMADIPQTTGQPDRGAGAYQFTGYTLYDPLVAWEMDVANRPGKLVPGLATEWAANPVDRTKWSFKLRPGVKFHDGSDFSADAVIWNFEKVLNPQAPHFDNRQAAQVRPGPPAPAQRGELAQARRHDRRSHHPHRGQHFSLPDAVVPDPIPGAIRTFGPQLGALCAVTPRRSTGSRT